MFVTLVKDMRGKQAQSSVIFLKDVAGSFLILKEKSSHNGTPAYAKCFWDLRAQPPA